MLPDRFWQKVTEGPGGCWLWTATKRRNGYGVFRVAGVLLTAHRLAYEDLIGPIPEGLDLDHLCRVRDCVNPWHMDPVTRSVNIRRGIVGEVNRLRGAAITHCPQKHPYDEANTRIDHKGKRNCRACDRDRARARRLAVAA